MRSVFFAVVCLILFGCPLAGVAGEPHWEEVRPGEYVARWTGDSGWEVFAGADRDKANCKIAKPIRGGILYSKRMGGYGPILNGSLYLAYEEGYHIDRQEEDWQVDVIRDYRVSINPRWSYKSAEFREIGDRFMRKWEQNIPLESLKKFEGLSLEFSVVSYEYPKIFVGLHETSGVIDISGTGLIESDLTQCKEALEAEFGRVEQE